MAGAAKNRARKEKKSGSSDARSSKGSSQDSSKESSKDSGKRSTPQSLPRYDGNKDPIVPGDLQSAMLSIRTVDVQNISEALGFAGWSLYHNGKTTPFPSAAHYYCSSFPNFLSTGDKMDFEYCNHPLYDRYHVPTGIDMSTRPKLPEKKPPRPPPNQQGKQVRIGLNTFSVEALPTSPVLQFDVLIGSGEEKRAVIKKCWHSRTVQEKIGQGWIFDGNRIAWSLRSPLRKGEKELNLMVDLDVDYANNPEVNKEGTKLRDINTLITPKDKDGNPISVKTPPKKERSNKFRVIIRFTTQVDFTPLHAFLAKQTDFDNTCLQSINFLDHLLRESPSQRYTQIKKAFYSTEQAGRFDLGSMAEAFKGVYASMRVAMNPLGKASLSVNVDVANGTFWRPICLWDAMNLLLKTDDKSDLRNMFGRHQARDNWKRSRTYKDLSRLNRVKVKVTHRSDERTKKAVEYCIDEFLDQDCNTFTFTRKIKNPDGTLGEKTQTLAEYFREKYNFHPQRWMPLVQMTKGKTVLPPDICIILPNQRYLGKLDDRQTSQMIKFAVTPPSVRWQAIEHGLRMLDWGSDRYMKNYGLKINPQKTVVNGRLLPAPRLEFGKLPGKSGRQSLEPNKIDQGRWRIDGLKFARPNPEPLVSWGIALVQAGRGTCDMATGLRFFKRFVQVYQSHGARFDPSKPMSLNPDVFFVSIPQRGDFVTPLWNKIGNKANKMPQIIFWVVPDRNPESYIRIKRFCECRLGVVSQVLQQQHVIRCQDQYISNICMKVNAKLGGITSIAKTTLPKVNPHGTIDSSDSIPPRSPKPTDPPSTMCIGADVSHPAAGSTAGSYAAITMSADLECSKYMANVDSNGIRLEQLAPYNWYNLFVPMARWWMSCVNFGRIPDRVFYFRDGVSESEYNTVLEREVKDMKLAWKEVAHDAWKKIKVTCIIGTKRHHIRFFPEKGGFPAADKNGNPKPGTLVESGVTHPFEWDFYLCSHSAIKGTARPMHYYVLLNETEVGAEELQQFIYEHSYQYVRSCTPVSQFPAIYYAHTAANRAKCHEPHEEISFAAEERKKREQWEQKVEQKRAAREAKKRKEAEEKHALAVKEAQEAGKAPPATPEILKPKPEAKSIKPGKSEKPGKSKSGTETDSKSPKECTSLLHLKMNPQNRIFETMWYV